MYSELNESLDGSKKKQPEECCTWNFSIVLISLVCLGLIALCTILVISNFRTIKHVNSRIEELNITQTSNYFNNTYTNGEIPPKFLVPKTYLLPNTNQMNIGTCWSFAAIYLLESQYRNQGIKKGFLNENEYVSLSKQAYFTYLHRECTKNPSIRFCKYGGLAKTPPVSADGQLEVIYYFGLETNLKKSIVPESVCPYNPLPPDPQGFDYFKCDDLDNALKTNPIEYEVKSTSYAFTIPEAKKLLHSKKRPLGVGAPLPSLVYYIPCSDTMFSEADDCKKRLYPCPDNRDEFCHKEMIDSRESDGVFLSKTDISRVSEMGGHAINIIGYNDQWTYRSRFQNPKTADPGKGGFILHNSWAEQGHSVEYLMGLRSEEDEMVVCPNHQKPDNWIPVTESCLSDNPENYKTNCSIDIQRIRGFGIAKGPDALKCSRNSDICNITDNFLYFLERQGNETYITTGIDGLQDIHLLKFNQTTHEIQKVSLKHYPLWRLYKQFAPIETIENNKDVCGYWIMPYQSIEMLSRINWDLLDNFRVFDMEVEFADHSYSKSHSPGYDYHYIDNSTHTLNEPEIPDSPVPFGAIYH